MSFAAAAWLWAIAPWIAVTAWLWRRQAPLHAVPFVHLWPQSTAVSRRSRRPPPVGTILVLLAMLASIIGAADPQKVSTPASRISSTEPVARRDEIVAVAMAETPIAQLMIRIQNGSADQSAALHISEDQETVEHPIQLPALNDTRNYFVNLPTAGNLIKVELNGERWQLTRRPGWPNVKADAAVSDDVRKVVQAYSLARAGNPGRVIRVSDARKAEVVVDRGGQNRRVENIRTADHPIVEHVQLGSLLGEEVQLAEPPPGFQPVLWLNEKPGIAVKESPRQVWFGLSSETLVRSTSYVVLWTDLLDWVGNASSGYDISRDATSPIVGPSHETPSTAATSISPWLFVVALMLLSLAGLQSAGPA